MKDSDMTGHLSSPITLHLSHVDIRISKKQKKDFVQLLCQINNNTYELSNFENKEPIHHINHNPENATLVVGVMSSGQFAFKNVLQIFTFETLEMGS